MNNQINLTVHIIDDDIEVLNACCFLLDSLQIKNQRWSSAIDFIQSANIHQMGIVLSDIMMPHMDGKKLQLYLIEQNSPMSFIALTGRGELNDAVNMMKLGAMDYLEKPIQLHRLQNTLIQAQTISEQKYHRLQCEIQYQSLTEKEKQIAALMLQGKLNKVMADELGIAVRTVEVHRAHIMEKMQSKHLSELVQKLWLIQS